MRFIKVKDLLEESKLKLKQVKGSSLWNKKIVSPDMNRPGISLVGWFKLFTKERIQVFGRKELEYLKELSQKKQFEIIKKLLSYDCCCLVITRNMKVPSYMLTLSEESQTSIFVTPLGAFEFIRKLVPILEEKLAPVLIFHGDLVEVYGVGILMLGESGIGKSECSLELVKRGHQLISDDVVEVYKSGGGPLIGKGLDIIKHHIEIRGLGIINVRAIYGIGAVKDKVSIDLVCYIEKVDMKKKYDRIGLLEEVENILDVEVSKVTIPVRVGRSLASLVEVAAMNHRCKEMGYFSAKEFNKRLINWIKGKELT